MRGAANAAVSAVSAVAMAAAAVLALAAVAASQGAAYHLHVWPRWRRLSGGSSGWLAAAVELLAVVPVLLLPTLCHPALQPVVSWPGAEWMRAWHPRASCACALYSAPCGCAHSPRPARAHQQAAQLRAPGRARLRAAAGTAILCSSLLAALLAVACCALFGGDVQVRGARWFGV